jgi:DeoR/GlpR family transcriptional regulator of sugar metabolism
MGITPIDSFWDVENSENDAARLKRAMFNAAERTVVLLASEKQTSPLELQSASTGKIVNFATELTGS